MNCPACGFGNRPGVRFCENCGASLSQSVPPPAAQTTGRFCPNCGTPNPASARFCKSCRFSFASNVPSQPIYAAASSRQTSNPVFFYLIEAVGGLLLIGALLAGIFLFMSGRLTLPIAPQVIVLTQPPIVVTQVQPPVATQIQPPTAQPQILVATAAPPPIIVTATSQPPADPTFTASQNALCRAGPSKAYGVSTSLNAGQSAPIIGKSSPEWQDWWQVNIQGVKCWIWSGLGTTSGDMSRVYVVDAPPMPQVYLTVANQSGFAICEAYLTGYPILQGVLYDGDSTKVKITPGETYSLRVVYQGELNPCGSIGEDNFSNISCDSNCTFTVR